MEPALEKLEVDYPKMDNPIKYLIHFGRIIIDDFERKLGEDALIYKNEKLLMAQRGVINHFIKKAGANILKNKSVMSVSLPVKIFSPRTLLELFVHRNLHCSTLLEKAGEIEDPNEQMRNVFRLI